ncbi:MAG: murein biosynthesis integral membrane protein MurJ [Aquimonas sp.]|nr:murein biosynthesis integral membrane protein MurJ [Aquimonas sp.]
MPSLLRSLASFSGPTFLSRILGLVREMVLAWTFGASTATDAFAVAFRIPNFFRRLFAEGSFSLAFVPVFTEYKLTREQAELRELIARTAGTLGAVLLVVTALGMLFAPQIGQLFSPSSAADPVKAGLIADLLRLTFPFLLFVSLTALAGGALNTFGRFALPAATPLILNLCMIAGAWLLAPRLEVPILALGYAVLLAGVLQLLLQFPALRQLDLLVWPRWGGAHAGVRRVMWLMLPTLFGSSVAQVNLLLDTVIAAYLVEGSQTWLSYTDRLVEFPLGLFGVALGTVILPALSRHHVSTDVQGYMRALDWGLRLALLIALPAMLGLALLATPILATLFQYGAFGAFDTRMVAMALMTVSAGLPAFILIKVVAPAFYARQDTATPVKIGIIAMVSNMAFNFGFLALLLWWRADEFEPGLGVFQRLAALPGLHLALSLASVCSGWLNLVLLWRVLRARGLYQPLPGWGRHLLRLSLACLAMAAALLAGRELWPDFGDYGALGRVWRLSALVGGGAVVFALAMLALGFRPRDMAESGDSGLGIRDSSKAD